MLLTFYFAINGRLTQQLDTDFNVFKCMLMKCLLTLPDNPSVRGGCYMNGHKPEKGGQTI